MNGKTHMITSTVLAVGLSSTLKLADASTTQQAIYFAGTLVGSPLPDIDHPNSLMGRRVWGWAIPNRKTRNKVAWKIHRKFTHYVETFIVGALLTAIFVMPNHYAIGAGLIVGYLGHLLGDMCTKSGIPCLVLRTKHLKFPWTYRSGTPSVEVPIMLICGCFLAWYFLR